MPFWTLPWRRNAQPSGLTESNEVDICHNLPDVTHSNSSETSSTIHDDVQCPGTPEGLRPRPSIKTLRLELKIDVEHPPTRNFLVEKKVDEARMLPPAPSRSWSMPSQPSLPEMGGYAPKKDAPTLDVGKTQTAVGNFVAHCQQESSHPMSPHVGGYDGDADGSQSKRIPLPWSKPSVIEEEKKEEQNECIQQVYYPLEKDPVFLSRTPPPRCPSKRYPPLSPFSTNISLEASPSSLAKPYTRYEKPAANHDTSFSSAAALLAHPESIRYDFGRYGTEETKEIHLKITSDQTHVSGMTQSVAMENDGSVCDMHYSCESDDGTSFGRGDETLRHRKVQNQRRTREDMLLAIVERLQDNVQLVADVYKVDATALQTNWYVETPLDEEGLLTGFSPEKRKMIMRQLSAMLDEMDVAQPEDFFLSPSQIQQYMQPHEELQSAISFCRTLVQMAAPSDSNGHWDLLPGYRAAMGVISTESPTERRRGSDTSLFTLPSASEQTPMTSNVSFSTTIASSRQTHRQPFLKVDGLQVRHAIELLSTLLQKLSLCCHALVDMNQLETEKTVQITKQIKRYYQQLLAVDHAILRSLVDAFALEVASPALTQLESTDAEDDGNLENRTRTVVIPPPRVVRSSFPKPRSTPRSTTSSSHDLFSPQTMDMMSERMIPTCVPEEYDDLRRQVGSVDYDDDDCEVREGPESGERE